MSKILKDDKFLNILKLAFISFEKDNNLPRGEIRKEISKDLGFSTVAQFNKIFDIFEDRYLKLDELFIIINTLDIKQQKMILDYVNKKFNFICTYNANDNNSINNIDNSMFNINALIGSLNQEYLIAKEDNNLTEFEINELVDKSYLARQALINNENKLKSLIK